MPRPPSPNSGEEIEPTIIEKFARRVSDMWKPDPNASEAKNKFAEADGLFLNKEYDAALDVYEAAAELSPNSALEEDAMFMIAECSFFSDEYPKAKDAYNELIKRYGNTRHLDQVTERLYAIGTYWRNHQQQKPSYSITPNLIDGTRPWFDTGGHALKAYEAVWLNDPTGPLADDSVMETAKSHFNNENWRDADQFFTQLRKDFPNSKHIVNAFILGYRSKLNTYQGPGYDPGPLLGAEELIETLKTQFANQLTPQQRQLIAGADREVQAQKAEREWYLGEVFYRQGSNRAAAYYYQAVIKNYPDQTEFVRQAQQRLQEIADLPPTPAKRMAWLSKLLPGQKVIPKPVGWQDPQE